MRSALALQVTMRVGAGCRLQEAHRCSRRCCGTDPSAGTAGASPSVKRLEWMEAEVEMLGRLSDALTEDELRALSPRLQLGSGAASSGSLAPGTSVVGAEPLPSAFEGVTADDLADAMMLSLDDGGCADTTRQSTEVPGPSADVAPPKCSPSPPVSTERSGSQHPLALAAPLPAEEQLLQLLRYPTRAPLQRAAAELLLEGTDYKALLRGGSLRGLRLSHKSMCRGDFTRISFLNVSADRCDFSRSIFYGAHLSDCTFTRCTFDGAILKNATVGKNVTFHDCSFRFAVVGLQESSPTPKQKRKGSKEKRTQTPAAAPAVSFHHCDLDLSDFEGFRVHNVASVFLHCANSTTAANFPARKK